MLYRGFCSSKCDKKQHFEAVILLLQCHKKCVVQKHNNNNIMMTIMRSIKTPFPVKGKRGKTEMASKLMPPKLMLLFRPLS